MTHLFEVPFLPDLLAVDLEERLPIRIKVTVLFSAHEHALSDVIEAPVLMGGLPSQVYTPAHVIGEVG